jgi:hypothetical protein
MTKKKRDKLGEGSGVQNAAPIADGIDTLGTPVNQLLRGQYKGNSDEPELKDLIKDAVTGIQESQEAKTEVETLKELISSPGGSRSALAELKEAGLDLKSLLSLGQDERERLFKIAEAEREARLEQEEKAIKAQQENKSTELEMMLKMMQLQNEMQAEYMKQQTESINQMMANLAESIEKLAEEKGPNSNNKENKEDEDDPIRDMTKALLERAINERLQPPPDPIEYLVGNANRLEQVREALGVKDTSGLDPLAIDFQKVKNEAEFRREELAQKREIAERQLSVLEQGIQHLGNLMPGITQALSGSESGGAGAGNDNNNLITCLGCGEQFDISGLESLEDLPKKCPSCGSDIDILEDLRGANSE